MHAGAANIARYAWGEDYHEVLGRRQHLLIGWLKEHADGAFEAVGYVDTGPVQEKALAAAAGLGWIGKHTCLINQELGSWLFLSVILTTLDLPAGSRVPDRCGTCTRCLDVCPDRTRSSSPTSWTRRAACPTSRSSRMRASPPTQREWVGSQVYGCDLCQDVCPWNTGAAVTDDPVWVARPLWRAGDAWRSSGAPPTRTCRSRSGTARCTARRCGGSAATSRSPSPPAATPTRTPRCSSRATRPSTPRLRTPSSTDHVAWARRRIEQTRK